MADSLSGVARGSTGRDAGPDRLANPLILLLFGVAIFLGANLRPPSLMDDVDAVNAQIALNMLQSGDWVTARINGVVYLEKSPLGFWLMAASCAAFGPRDWAARWWRLRGRVRAWSHCWARSGSSPRAAAKTCLRIGHKW